MVVSSRRIISATNRPISARPATDGLVVEARLGPVVQHHASEVLLEVGSEDFAVYGAIGRGLAHEFERQDGVQVAGAHSITGSCLYLSAGRCIGAVGRVLDAPALVDVDELDFDCPGADVDDGAAVTPDLGMVERLR